MSGGDGIGHNSGARQTGGVNGGPTGMGTGNPGGANVGLGGTMDTYSPSGFQMHVDGTHALQTGSGVHWGGGDGHGSAGGAWGPVTRGSSPTPNSPVVAHTSTTPIGEHSPAKYDNYMVALSTELEFRVIVTNDDPNNMAVQATKVPRGSNISGPKIAESRYNDVKNIVKDFMQYETAMKLLTDFYKEVFNKYGENNEKIAKELADSAKGKQIRNVDQALRDYDKYKGNINNKFNAQDRQAMARAIESVNRDLVSQNLLKFGKAFGIVGTTIDVVSLLNELAKGVETGDFKGFGLKAESLRL
ncbi:Colicin-Ia [Serratia quinivorans]|uniref:colicin-like pore-forming protein n=1 Tax=Serratia quinivorans TaxID=137545 RepID=UPI002177EE20|nr:colicin-like pore-forming protein [Serratia quinivorans]CAI1810988.1 Colicin-Ia [Serratia quinivorans]